MMKSMFEPCVGTSFRAQLQSDDSVSLTLVEAADLPRIESDGAVIGHQDPFELVFQEPQNSLLEQGLYTLAHDSLGERDVFLVPVGISIYEAVFN